MTKNYRHLVISATLVALAACSGSDAAPPPLDTEAPTTTVDAPETTAAEMTTTSTKASRRFSQELRTSDR